MATATWHAAAPDGDPPLSHYKYHLDEDCGNLQRITRPQPERLRRGMGGLDLCFNCRERRDNRRRGRR